MKPNPIDMLMFLEVAEARSFTAAAARLGKTTSAVSQAVSRLEHELGCRLLYRTTRSLSLTDAGARALAHCRDLERIYSSAKSELTEAHRDPAGTLTVTAPHALCASVVGPALQQLLSAHPDLSSRLIADDTPVDLVEQQIDVAIRVGNPTQQSARVVKIGVLREALYCSPSYIDGKGGSPASLAALKEWDHIANDWQGSPVTYAGSSRDSVRVTPRFRCNTVRDVFQFAVSGAGVALLPEPIAEPAVGQKSLRRLFSVSSTPIYAVHLFEKRAPAKVKRFIALLKQVLGEFPDFE